MANEKTLLQQLVDGPIVTEFRKQLNLGNDMRSATALKLQHNLLVDYIFDKANPDWQHMHISSCILKQNVLNMQLHWDNF
jgi:hypothetical protein